MTDQRYLLVVNPCGVKCPGCGELVVVPTVASLQPRTLAKADEAHSPVGPSVRPLAAADPSPAAQTEASSSASETSAAAHHVAPPNGAPWSSTAVSLGAAPQAGLPGERGPKSAFRFGGVMMGGELFGISIGTLVVGSLIHFLHLRFRGANYSIVTTLRVVSYVGGVMALRAAPPCLGPQLAPIGGTICTIIRLSAAPETSKVTATGAVLLSMAILSVVLWVALLSYFLFGPHMAA